MVSQSGLPVQRACQAIGLGRTTYYRPVVNWAQRDAAVIEALTTLGATKPLRASGKTWIGCGIRAIGGTISTCGVSIVSSV